MSNLFDDMVLDDDLFKDISKNEYDRKMNVGKTTISDNDYKFCNNCKCEMQIHINNMYICPDCGVINNVITDNNEYETSITRNYNTNNTYHLPIKCVGSDAHKYNAYIRNCTSNYTNIHKNLITKKLGNYHLRSSTINIPKKIINKSIDTYFKMREHNISYRANILDSILAMIIYYECLENKIAIKQSEIAEWFNIPSSIMSKSDKILKELKELGILEINMESENIEYDFIKSYLQRINIDDKNVDFLYELYNVIEDAKIGNIHSRLSTKSALLIYILIKLDPAITVSDEEITKEFLISITTIKNHITTLLKYSEILEPVITKYNYDYTILISKRRNKVKSKTDGDFPKKREKLERKLMAMEDTLVLARSKSKKKKI